MVEVEVNLHENVVRLLNAIRFLGNFVVFENSLPYGSSMLLWMVLLRFLIQLPTRQCQFRELKGLMVAPI